MYALVEAETRIGCLIAGLDPGVGIVHADYRGRDSFALDLMEAVRPQVDGYVLDLAEQRVFRASDFHETRKGGKREQYVDAFHGSGLRAIAKAKQQGGDPTHGEGGAVHRAESNVQRKREIREWDERHGKLTDLSAFDREVSRLFKASR